MNMHHTISDVDQRQREMTPAALKLAKATSAGTGDPVVGAAVSRAKRAKKAAVALNFDALLAASTAARARHSEAMRADDAARGTAHEDAADQACEEACTAGCIADCAVFDAPASNLDEVITKLRLHLEVGRFEADYLARPSWNGSQIDDKAIMAKIIADLERLASAPPPKGPKDDLIVAAADAYPSARQARQALNGDGLARYGESAETDEILKREDDVLNVALDMPAGSLPALAAKARMVRAFYGEDRLGELADLGERMVGALTHDLIELNNRTGRHTPSAGLRDLELDFDTPLKALAAQAVQARRSNEDYQIMEASLGQGARETAEALDRLVDALRQQASFVPARSVVDLIRHTGLIAQVLDELYDHEDHFVGRSCATIHRHAYAIANGLEAMTGLRAEALGGFCTELEPSFDPHRPAVERAALLWIRAAGAERYGSQEEPRVVDDKISHRPDDNLERELKALRPAVQAEIKRLLRAKGGAK